MDFYLDLSMLTGAQIRSARAALGWSAGDLAVKAGVATKTIMRLESVDGIPQSRTGTLLEIKAVLESAGIEFIGTPSDRPGIRFALPTKSRD
jgi:ribosome-binding protein aMBF1 (putative translation factor)